MSASISINVVHRDHNAPIYAAAAVRGASENADLAVGKTLESRKVALPNTQTVLVLCAASRLLDSRFSAAAKTAR